MPALTLDLRKHSAQTPQCTNTRWQMTWPPKPSVTVETTLDLNQWRCCASHLFLHTLWNAKFSFREKIPAAGSQWFCFFLPSSLVKIFPANVFQLLSHHCCWTFILNKSGWCVRDWFSTYLQEKREKQVWNKRRQVLYTVEKVGIRALCILKTS